MNKKRILIIVALLIVGGVITTLVIINNNWGEYESDVVKSELSDTVEFSNDEENFPPSMDELEGIFTVEKGSGTADILFYTDGLKSTKGGFKAFTISLEVPDDYKSSTLQVTIQTNSIDTGNEMRDEHLLEPEFFHASKYPEIEFISNELTLGDTSYIAKGELTLNGTTKELDVPFKHLGSGENESEIFEAFEGAFKIDRTAFGQQEESGVGNIVEISFYCELKNK